MGEPLALADPSAGFRDLRIVRWAGVEPHGLRAAGADHGQDLSNAGVIPCSIFRFSRSVYAIFRISCQVIVYHFISRVPVSVLFSTLFYHMHVVLFSVLLCFVFRTACSVFHATRHTFCVSYYSSHITCSTEHVPHNMSYIPWHMFPVPRSVLPFYEVLLSTFRIRCHTDPGP